MNPAPTHHELIRNGRLILSDGTYFTGRSVGFAGTAFGELCFNTGMTGYQEVFTDPSYLGQIMVMTAAHIGNYGVRSSDQESGRVQISGLIVRNLAHTWSRKKGDGGLSDYLISKRCVTMADVDTRALVQHIRSRGSMNAVISDETLSNEELIRQLNEVPSMEGLDLSKRAGTGEPYVFEPDSGDLPSKTVVVVDYGTKTNILRLLKSAGFKVVVAPFNSSSADIFSHQPDGILLSNGPGDPAAMKGQTEVIRELIQRDLPVMGICLGHQLLARALGVGTFKMHHGHRGINHPVQNLLNGRSEITSQNHGFGVDPVGLKDNPDLQITHINLNDKTVEGFRHRTKPLFSVQHHPEACPGPQDSRYLFDEFARIVGRVQ
ncbi:MAG: glutamine-hydrolyzing carbamoyl-phosphate synthase small subunit [Sphingomonadales bacterium]|nr:glutamine-hydrolyzing carbamoyl-phosphate synthase small subunit [Sphingomonadales bacterium]